MNATFEFIFYIATGIICLVLVFWMLRTEKRLKKFFSGKKAKDLESVIGELEQNIAELKTAKTSTEKELAGINSKLRKSIRGLQTIRFNPFPDQGGNQSFALGMLNEDGDGVILSSLYSRDRNSVFAKPVRGGRSEHELTEEEKEVLQKAKI
jgi:hypothetical protein